MEEFLALYAEYGMIGVVGVMFVFMVYQNAKRSDAQARKNSKTLMLESATGHKHGALNTIQTQHIMITGICLDHGTQNK